MNDQQKSTFVVMFGNRGFFPASLQATARQEMRAVLEEQGYQVLMMDENETQYGAVETPADGQKFARFLEEHRGKYGGVILSLPNFGDETGAVTALKAAGVPILIQAYPDDLDKMSTAQRRDAFCGKFSIMDVFCQYGVKFTALTPHTVNPRNARFLQNLDYFDRLCRVTGGMKDMIVGAIGARTTPFKTVRIDELALQRHGITVETVDMSEVFRRIEKLDEDADEAKEKAQELRDYAHWDGVPEVAFDRLVRLGVVIDQLIDEFELDAYAIRCWLELQEQLGISPCVVMSQTNERGKMAACEVDVGSAVTMYALRLASGESAACLDWNNNYGEEDDKCILFHCGPVPRSMMTKKGKVDEHEIFAATAVGPGCSYGCNLGRIQPNLITFGNLLTDSGQLKFYLGQGRITDDTIPDDYFGCAGVAEVDGLQSALQKIGYAGHRHHVTITPGHVAAPLHEAFTSYLGYEVLMV